MSTSGITRRSFLRGTVAVTTLAASGSLLAACGDGTEAGGAATGGAAGTEGGAGAEGAANALEQAREQGFLRVGFANEAPYGFADEAGNLTGEAPEAAKVVTAELGVPELDGVLTDFASLIPGLQAGRFDMIAAGMFITPERCAEILFSDPDYCATQAFAVAAGNPLGLESYDDVAANPEVRLGILSGAVEEGYATAAGVAESQISNFPDPTSGMEGLQADRVDAFALTSISIRNLLDTFGGDAELAGPFVPVVDGEEQLGCGGYGFRPGQQSFRDEFNEALNALKESGDIVPIIEPFGFGEEEVDAAQELDADSLCEAEA
ncbi:MAG: ectoine/hydroxyectoine ABC transporter substrate-binding protein EhuB [Egibacteraceae bacterium]